MTTKGLGHFEWRRAVVGVTAAVVLMMTTILCAQDQLTSPATVPERNKESDLDSKPTEATDGPAEDWSSVVLWNSDEVSARLFYKASASLADASWLVLELENHTPQPLDFGQTWLSLNSTRKEIPSGKVLATGGGPSGVFSSIKTLPPGRHRYSGDILEYASGNLGLPPAKGLQIEVQVDANTQTKGGKRYQTPADKPTFKFEWRYPSAEEMTAMSGVLKRYMAAPADIEKHLPRLSALLMAPQVRDSLTLDDYLPALNAVTDSNTRHLLAPYLFARYSDAPRVLAYYREAFQKHPDVVYWDAASTNVWNEEFLEPLVQGCEQGKWHYFDVLCRHSADWRNKPLEVARVSAALLKHHPILQRDARKIPEAELELWAKAVLEAGDVADPALVELLKPALEDQRPARIDYGAGGVNEGRVCDRALFAILKILDGDSWAAFKKAGITGWSTEEQRMKACDRVLVILKERLKSSPSPTKP